MRVKKRSSFNLCQLIPISPAHGSTVELVVDGEAEAAGRPSGKLLDVSHLVTQHTRYHIPSYSS